MITAEDTDRHEEASPHEGNGDISLLVVDDSEPSREALSRRLQRRGYRVASAPDGARALELVAREPFDLVLLDVMMPGVNGLDVLRQIRQDRSATDLPVIMATARDGSEDLVEALALGANDYVTKPLDFAVVLARVQTQLALRDAVQRLVRLEERLSERNAELEAANEKLHQDLRAAARVQEAFLPHGPADVPGARFAWSFTPCEELAGDGLNVFPVGPGRVGLYVLDVSGHGVAAALLAVSLSRLLSAGVPQAPPPAGAPPEGVEPAEVLARLNRLFPWDPDTERYFTILYGVLDVRTGEFRYASAGHPPAVHVPRGAAPVVLPGVGLPIGLGEQYTQHGVQLRPGDRLYLYSDGITEAFGPGGKGFGTPRLLESFDRGRSVPLGESVNSLLADVLHWTEGARPRDDLSVLAAEFTGSPP